MASLNEPLEVRCGLVSPNRIMRAAMSEALADPGNSPVAHFGRLYRTPSRGIR
jgi:2,4-dienoyl-CoA reductase-like NADH-dependent reductase (Old Yellow Enzyme family)